MAKKLHSAEFNRGVRAAEDAIAEERAFWIVTDDNEEEEEGEHIDPRTGLPYLTISGEADDYVRGYNDTVLKASNAGKIKTDFRPLLMTRAQVVAAMKKTKLGVISPDNPVITAPGGEFTLELKRPKPLKTKKKPKQWISFRNREQAWPRWELYDEDNTFSVGVGREGRVVIIKNDYVYVTFDVRTTQVLDRYDV
jgi:hypothetical protein